MHFWIFIFFTTTIAAVTLAVEVHFETSDSGFFLKHSPRQPTSPAIGDLGASSSANTGSSSGHIDGGSHSGGISSMGKSRMTGAADAVLSVDRFTVIQTMQPVSIRASYGPFSTKQTVPARYIVPDVVETQSEHMQNATAALLDLQQSNLHLDISAHLVQQTIPRDAPVLRVLFHAGADPGGHFQRQKICVLLHISMGTKLPLKGRCMPEGEDGVCVAEVIIPSSWWPALPPPDKDSRGGVPPKSPQRLVQVSYSVFEPPARNPEQCEPKIQIQPLTPFVQVPLVPALSAYKELRADDTLTMLVPHQPLYPMSRIHVPVFLQQVPKQNIAVFIVRARVKAGLKILGATASSDEWNVSVEKENAKHTVARVTAFRKDQDPDSSSKDITDENVNSNMVQEIFSWLLEVANDTKEHWDDGGRIVWSVSYVHGGPKMRDSSHDNVNNGPPEETRRKLSAKLEIKKDDIQAVLPISKNWELMNTAVLTGRQVSQAMKVFIVSQAGTVADVTLQSSCYAEDESVIKVSSSCSSVYVDGSEGRGSSNASISVKYGEYSGRAKFIVWMPEFPLEVSVTDFRLSQIKSWKIPDDPNGHGKLNKKRRKRAFGWSNHHGGGGGGGGGGDEFANGIGTDRLACRARYQQSPVEVYARFLAVDQDSGRVSYLISRRTGLRVTDLVQPLLRVADPKIATLRGRMLQGRAMGRTDVQVLSPISGRVIGSKEIRVGSDKVSIVRLIVRVVSGLQLTIAPDSAIENGYIAETSVTRRLTAQYQEGLLDIDLEFSDGTKTPLREISVDDYFLLVESLDTEVVAFAPMLASHHPRVIAVGEGNGDLLRITLVLSEECRLRRNLPLSKQGSKSTPAPLASALASVQVDFSTPDTAGRPDTVQNDGISGKDRKGSRYMGDLADILIGIPFKDENNDEPTIQARQHRGGGGGGGGGGITPLIGGGGGGGGYLHHGKNHPHATDMSSLEIGMYVLLTAFCFAIVVFVVSCVVYASKFKPIRIESSCDHIPAERTPQNAGLALMRDSRRSRESTTNAHDWVWLGRSTIDRSIIEQEMNGNNVIDNQAALDSRIRITNNPINMNYADPDDTIPNVVTSFDNPDQMELPLSGSGGGDNVAATTGTAAAAVAALAATTVKPTAGIIDTSTYNKRDRRIRQMPVENPPPLPPHGIPAIDTNGHEYRPPVPPHRNIGVTVNLTQPTVAPNKNANHKHNHNNNNPNNNNNNNRVSTSDATTGAAPSKRHYHHTKHQKSSNPNRKSVMSEMSAHNATTTATAAAAANSTTNGMPPQYHPNHHAHPYSHAHSHAIIDNGNGNGNGNDDGNIRGIGGIGGSIEAVVGHLKLTQQHINAALFNATLPIESSIKVTGHNGIVQAPLPPPLTVAVGATAMVSPVGCGLASPELHMAERLVEKNAFQFDTDTPHIENRKRESKCISMMDSGIGLSGDIQLRSNNEQTGTTGTGSSDDKGGFVTPPGDERSLASPANALPKRSTVVGNPMFGSSPDSDLGPGESLGLDDMDMDYEQIMHYFDNLKESNA